MNRSKIQLSSAETELMSNASIILTKNMIIRKIKLLLEEVQIKQQEYVIENELRQDFFKVPPKISKGENYMGLPYIILDYPRMSDPDHFIFIRTMFWWGHYFSSTLQAGGKRKQEIAAYAAGHLISLQSGDYFIGINTDPWVHHFEETNYCNISTLDNEKFLNCANQSDYIKIAAKWPLDEWPFAADELFNRWKFLLTISGLIA